MKKLKKPYKSSTGHLLTQSLFYEHWINQSVEDRTEWVPPFALRHTGQSRDMGCVEFHSTFVELGDPTGYEWALKYLGSWEHFERLQGNKRFRDALEEARKELHIKEKAASIQRIKQVLEDGSEAQALQAAKYLAEQGYEEKTTAKRGRPSKAEVTSELQRLAQLSKEEQEDFDRIKGVIN